MGAYLYCKNLLVSTSLALAFIGAGNSDLYAECRPGRPKILVGTPASLSRQRIIARQDNLSMLTEDSKKKNLKGYGFIDDFIKRRLLVGIRDSAAYDLDRSFFLNGSHRNTMPVLTKGL